MTFKEANNMIDDISWFYGGESITTDDIVECREICHKALEKQIPKKPLAHGKYGFDCPSCKQKLNVEREDISVYDMKPPEHCEPCGQALDWSDNK